MPAAWYPMAGSRGFTIPVNAVSYWVGEAMQKTDLKDLPEIPEKVLETARMTASSAAHLARLLKASAYPGVEQDAERHQS